MKIRLFLGSTPRLARYAGSIRFGVRSRDFSASHDGMSYMVHRLRWIDQRRLDERRSGAGKGELRRARVQRLMEEADTVRKNAGVQSMRLEFEEKQEEKEEAQVNGTAANGAQST